MEISLVQINKIDRSPNHRLKGDVSELMISMRHNGLLIPIKLKKKTKRRFEVVFGNRRLAAAKKLGWKNIDAITQGGREFTKRKAALENVVENFNRVNPSIEDYTVAFERLRNLGMVDAEIAASLGVSEAKIKIFRKMKEGLPKRVAFKARSMDNRKQSKVENEITQQAAYHISLTGRGVRTPSVKMANTLAKESKKMPIEKFKQICKLIREGASPVEAKTMMNKYELVRFSAFVPKKIGKSLAMAQMKKALKKRGILKWKPVYPSEFGR